MQASHHRRTRRATAGMAVTAGLGVLGAAGLSTATSGAATPATPAGELLASFHALAAAKTMTVQASIGQGAKRIVVDVRVTGGGADSAGTIILGVPNGATPASQLDYVDMGTSLALRANLRFWQTELGSQVPAAVVHVIAGQWVLVPSSMVQQIMGGFAHFTTPSKLAAAFLQGIGTVRTGVVFGATSTVGGVKVRAIEDTGDSARVEVPVSGSPAPVAVYETAKANSDYFRFTYPSHLALRLPKAVSLQTLIARALKG